MNYVPCGRMENLIKIAIVLYSRLQMNDHLLINHYDINNTNNHTFSSDKEPSC